MKMITRYLPILLVLIVLLAAPASVQAGPLYQTGGQTITGDQLILGNDYILQAGQTLNGDLVILGGNASIEDNAAVNGDVALLGGNLNLTGDVNGMVAALGANVDLGKGATISGELISVGGNVFGAENAVIRGGIRTLTPRSFLFDRSTFRFPDFDSANNGSNVGGWFITLLGRVMRIFAMAVLAVIIVLIMPKSTKNVADTIADQPWMSGGAGLLTFLVTPVVLFLLTITIILIPLAILAGLAVAVAALFGWIALGYELGKRLAVLFKTEWADAVSAGLGTLVLGMAVGLVGFIPCLGGAIWFFIVCAGLGGVVLSAFGTRPPTYQKASTAPIVEVIPNPSPAPKSGTDVNPPVDSLGSNP